jgi:hypothetical protein
MNFKKITLSRVIHKVIGKKTGQDAFADAANDLHTLDYDTTDTLLKRIYDAIKKSKRFFETQLENTQEISFWNYAKDLNSASKKDFIDKTTSIAELAAEAHQNKNRPGGLLIIIDGNVDDHPAVIVIKAELQEALIINGNAVELIKELFLSPAKEFFKIGFLIRNKNKSKDMYETFVYDDNFTPQKNDLATYFYKDFLGFTTSENDKLRTNNFLKGFVDFVDRNLTKEDDFESRRLIKTRIKADYRESSNHIIDPKDYSDFFKASNELSKKYESSILKQFPRSFTKDLSLVDSSLQKTALQITSDLRILGPSDLVDNVEVFNPNNQNGKQRLLTQIESGQVARVVTLKTDAIRTEYKRED